MDDITIGELCAEAHETAKSKGWWEEDLPGLDFGMKMALLHSEVSEALEEYRDGHSLSEIYYRESDGKPEGIPVELADVIIRICDLVGKHDLPLLRALREKLAFNKTRPHRHGGKLA